MALEEGPIAVLRGRSGAPAPSPVPRRGGGGAPLVTGVRRVILSLSK